VCEVGRGNGMEERSLEIGTGTIARTTTARPIIARCILLAQTIARSDRCSRGLLLGRKLLARQLTAEMTVNGFIIAR